MKYYDDDYEEGDEYQNDDTVRRPEIQQESLRGLDWLLAIVIAGLTGGLMTLWEFPGLSPHAWSHAAIGAGLRPIESIFPGFWNAIARGIYSITDISTGTLVLKVLGRVFAGLSVGLVYLLLRQILSITIRVRLQFSSRRFLVVRGVAVLGALFFACSDPVWRVGQVFTPSLLLLFMTILVLTLFFGFLMSGSMGQIYFSMFLLGLLSAETPFGFLLLALVWGVYLLALRHDAVASNSPLLNPIVEQSSKWHLTFLYAIGLIIGVAVNCYAFIAFDGLDVFQKAGADIPLLYATRWWTQLIHAASGMGWVLALGIGLLPFIVAAVLLPRAVDEEQFLPYHMGAVFFVAGALAFAQLAELPPLWFWTWTRSATVNSPFFLLVLMLFSSATVVFALAVMAVDICCRDHRRLAMQRFAELKEDDGGGAAGDSSDLKPLGAGARMVLVIVPVLLLAGVLPGRHQGQTRRMLQIVNDYAHEVLEECGNVKWIFTDGSFDSWLELNAAAQNRPLRALSMMSGNSAREQYIRSNGVTNQEDRITLNVGAPMTLRSWMHDHPERLDEIAIQLGFELWKRDGKEIPPCSGVLSRPAGMSEEDRKSGVERATEIADRILDIYAEGGPTKSAGPLANELFLFVQWRISRLARMRAEREDRAGNTELALKDVNISDRLDHNNASLKRIMSDMDKARERTLRSVTPRESLQLALARADFALARRYAEPILQGDPDDPNANFGVAMSYYTQKQWARAEEFLRKCLIKKPKEPAVWNNLAMVCLYTERFDEGLKFANKALEIIPESAEVKDTIKQLKEAREKANEKKGEEGKKGESNKKTASPAKTQSPAAPDVQPAETKPVTAVKENEPGKKVQTSPRMKPQPKAQSEKPELLVQSKPNIAPLRIASPQEEMQQAISRGDYEAAAQYAGPVLKVDPDDSYANFAVGMAHFGKREWEKADKHLRRAVKKMPDEPVFLNNLAIVLLYRGKYDDAYSFAKKALKVAPDSEGVKDTVAQIEKVLETEKSEKKKSAKPPKKTNKPSKKPVNKPKEAVAPKAPAADHSDEPDALEGLVPTAPAEDPASM